MSKQEFLVQLCRGLAGLPQDDIEERVAFYSEMIDDRMEEGLSEQEAVDGIGSVDAIVSQIVADIPLAKMVKEKIAPKKGRNAWEIVLLILGSPIWLTLLIAAFAVILSFYVVWWSVIISLWAVFVSFVGCALGGIVTGVGFALYGKGFTGLAMVGAGLVCTGLSIFLFYGCMAATKGTLVRTKKLTFGMKYWFVRKEEV